VLVAGGIFAATFWLGPHTRGAPLGTSGTATTITTSPEPTLVPATYVGKATFDVARSEWMLKERMELSRRELAEAATVLNRRPVRPGRQSRVVARFLGRSGWTESRFGDTTRYAYSPETQKTALSQWRPTKTIKLDLRTSVPGRVGPLLVAKEGSRLVLDTPIRMVRATFPPFTAKTNTLNGREQVTVKLGGEDDLPASDVRIEAANGFGRNVFVSQLLDLLALKGAGALAYGLGLLGTLFRKELTKRFKAWRQNRKPERPPARPTKRKRSEKTSR
jgi:hypothetical protein